MALIDELNVSEKGNLFVFVFLLIFNCFFEMVQTPLMLAAMHGKIDCVEKLLEAGANVCVSVSVGFPSMFHFNFMTLKKEKGKSYFIKISDYDKLSGFNV